MSSFDTMCLVNDIKDELGVSLQAKDFIEHKTVGDMAEYISTLK